MNILHKNDFHRLKSTQIIEEKENIHCLNENREDPFEKKRSSALEKLKKSLFSSNLYQILQVPPTASNAEIKKAYKKLSLKLHPDKNRQANKEDFHQLSFAYKILGNAEIREVYDEQGLEVAEMVLSMYEGNGVNFAEEMKF